MNNPTAKLMGYQGLCLSSRAESDEAEGSLRSAAQLSDSSARRLPPRSE